jgi:hypothetical protein
MLIPAFFGFVCTVGPLVVFCHQSSFGQVDKRLLFVLFWCGLLLTSGSILLVNWGLKEGVSNKAVEYTGIALVSLAAVLGLLALILHRHRLNMEARHEHEDLASFRAENVIPVASVNGNAEFVPVASVNGNVEFVMQDVPLPTAPPSTEEQVTSTRRDDPEDERREFVKTFLYRRLLQHGDSVRTLSALLNMTDDDTESQRNRLFQSIRSMASAASSVKPECSICLCGYEDGETVCWSMKERCNHLFHEDCIVRWLENHNDCPLCRTQLVIRDEEEN